MRYVKRFAFAGSSVLILLFMSGISKADNGGETLRDAFYAEGSMSAYNLKVGCNFRADDPDWVLMHANTQGHVPPECVGFFHAVMDLINTGEIRYLMRQDQCFDLMGTIPDLTTPVEKSFAIYASARRDDQLQNMDAIDAIIEAVVKDYPCTGKNAEGITRGVQKPQ